MDISVAEGTQGRQLDTAPPRPPRSSKSLMSMAAGDDDGKSSGLDMSNPAIQVMKAMGDARNSLIKLSSLLPPLAQGVQQIISGLESVVPQMIADLVSGNPAGSSGAGLGAQGASQAPTAPPVQTGMP